ncbi:PTS transporter subunit IIC [Caldisericum sp.]|uniref:PTS transporter subunit IIC n=1 Tax=Caldisericum sp. TaxID=2499687 RepID=UPI003D136F43
MAFINNLISTLGASLFLPFVLFIFALILGVKPGKAFRSVLLIAIALTALWWVLNPFIGFAGQAVSDMVKNSAVKLPYIDVGWPFAAAISYSTKIGALIIPIGLAINLVMLWLRWTDTFDLDLWNYWHWAFVGSMAYYATNNLWYGILAAIATGMAALILGDITAPAMSKFFNLPGLSFPHFQSQATTFVALPLNWVLDKIGLGKVHISSKTIREKLGIMGDSTVIAFILGIVIALLAWGKTKTNSIAGWATILTVGVVVAGAVYLFPKVIGALMEGLVPISESVRETFKKKGFKRELYFGMDTALTIGNPDVIATGLLVMITAIPLMFVLPGNKFIYLADLGVVPFFMSSTAVAITNGNILKSYIIVMITTIIGFYAVTLACPLFTQIVISLGKTLPMGVTKVGAGAMMMWTQELFYWLGETPIGLIILFASIFTVLFLFRKHKQAWYRAAGYVMEKMGSSKDTE